MTLTVRARGFMLILLLLVGLSSCSNSSADKENTDVPTDAGISVSEAYIKQPAPGQKMGAVYLKIHNPSTDERQLFAIETDVAGFAEVHRSFYEDGMRRMRHVQHLKISPKQTLTFEPGGYHIMLMDMVDLPPVGEHFLMRFEFDAGEWQTVSVEVRAVN